MESTAPNEAPISPQPANQSSTSNVISGHSPVLIDSPRGFSMHTADPNHQRTPSLGHIHQQLENEQEAQVNKLLQLIRAQQAELDKIKADTNESNSSQLARSEGPTSDSLGQTSINSSNREQIGTASDTRSPSIDANTITTRSPIQRTSSQSRRYSKGIPIPSAAVSISSSPLIRPQSYGRSSHDEWSLSGSRDESNFYQAETSMLQRENQMLKSRIRELERQLSDINGSGTGNATP